MMAELADTVDKLESITRDKTNSKDENDLVALILSGNGNTFCSGLGKVFPILKTLIIINLFSLTSLIDFSKK
jgi:hypothetical protein